MKSHPTIATEVPTLEGTESISSGMPAGPAGCGAFVLVLAVVVVLIGLLGIAVWWALRDMGLT